MLFTCLYIIEIYNGRVTINHRVWKFFLRAYFGISLTKRQMRKIRVWDAYDKIVFRSNRCFYWKLQYGKNNVGFFVQICIQSEISIMRELCEPFYNCKLKNKLSGFFDFGMVLSYCQRFPTQDAKVNKEQGRFLYLFICVVSTQLNFIKIHLYF